MALASATAASVTDAGLPVDARQSYAVFTRDTTGNTSPGVPLTTRTLGPSVKDTTRVSVRSNGDQANGFSYDPAISEDGRWITYHSDAANLVGGDTNTAHDVFLFDRTNGVTQRVSVRSDGGQATGHSYEPAISADGRWITYSSDATNLVDGDTNGAADVFLFDCNTGTTQRVSVRSNGAQATGGYSMEPAISADGRWITYRSEATNLVTNDTNGAADVFLFDRNTGTTQRVSIHSNGAQANDYSYRPAISADGRWITYHSRATNLVANDTNSEYDVFLFDRNTGTTQRVSIHSNGAQATGPSFAPVISADGRWITYSSEATNLVANDTNAAPDVFLFDRDTGTTQRVSVHSNGSQATGGRSSEPAISADGRWITYYSYATNLVDNDTNGEFDVFLFDLQTELTRRVSVHSNGSQATLSSTNPAVSAHGRWISYTSDAANLVANDTNSQTDVFLARMW